MKMTLGEMTMTEKDIDHIIFRTEGITLARADIDTAREALKDLLYRLNHICTDIPENKDLYRTYTKILDNFNAELDDISNTLAYDMELLVERSKEDN
jgi:hypothetical protein